MYKKEVSNLKESLKYYMAFTIACLLVLVASSCALSLPTTTKGPGLAPIQMTQIVTRLVTQEVTQEVTRVIEIPVTITPADTPIAPFTPTLESIGSGTPTFSATPQPPIVTIMEQADCMYGPGTMYLYKTGVLANDLLEVIGRNLEGSWIYVEPVDGWNPCWIAANQARFNSADINSIPIVFSKLPYSNQYLPPDASAHRSGTEVTVSWKAVWLSLDDYRGYLIEAWVCQNGKQIFIPISYVPALADNTGTLSITITDEPGCTVPSSARIYSAVKQGYSNWGNIPWPGY